MQELHDFAVSVVERINKKYGAEGYQPVVWLERSVPLYERIALYSVADVAVVAATRDGMNLVPYEYIVCRQGQPVGLLPWMQFNLIVQLIATHLLPSLGSLFTLPAILCELAIKEQVTCTLPSMLCGLSLW